MQYLQYIYIRDIHLHLLIFPHLLSGRNSRTYCSSRNKTILMQIKRRVSVFSLSDIFPIHAVSIRVPLYLPTPKQQRNVVLNAPVILSEDKTSTFEHVKNQVFSCREHHAIARKPTDSSQSLVCIGSRLVFPDYSNNCSNRGLLLLTDRNAHTTHVTHKHNQTCLPPAVMNDVWRQWIRAPPARFNYSLSQIN